MMGVFPGEAGLTPTTEGENLCHTRFWQIIELIILIYLFAICPPIARLKRYPFRHLIPSSIVSIKLI